MTPEEIEWLERYLEKYIDSLPTHKDQALVARHLREFYRVIRVIVCKEREEDQDELVRLRKVVEAAKACIRNPKWQGACDEEVLLEEAILQLEEL